MKHRAGSWELGAGSWELGAGSWELGCEALITDTIGYNLMPLQETGPEMIRLNLVISGNQDYQLIIDYYYK